MDHNESSPDFSEALLYKANNAFIEGDISEPRNAQEIRDNLDSRLGPLQSRFSLFRGRILVFGLFILNFCFAFVFLIAFMVVFHIRKANITVLGLIGAAGFAFGVLIIRPLSKLLIGHRVSDELKIYEDTPATRKDVYDTLIKAGEVVNGTIVDVVSLLGDVFITYTVKTPTYEVVKQIYNQWCKSNQSENSAMLRVN